MKRNLQITLTVMFFAFLSISANAQVATGGTYTLEQSVIAGGGGTSADATGNMFSLTGAIGQAITDTSSASPFTINSGFFTAPVVLAPTAAQVTIGGRAISSTGRGIRGVVIRLTDGSGSVRFATTTAFGYYRFTEVNAGETYIITAQGKRYEFAQPTQVLNVNEDATDVNFVAIPQ